MRLSLGISTCPNDTFIYENLIAGLKDSPFEWDVHYADVQTLNEMVMRGELDVAKVQYSAVKAWSPDGRHQYFRTTHFPVANVLLTNRGEADGLTTVKAFVTYLDAPGGAKDLGAV